MTRTRYTNRYVGIRISDGKYEMFTWDGTPVRETHGHIYSAVTGPFLTVGGAKIMVEHGPNNSHLTSRDADRIARQQLNTRKKQRA